MDTLAERPRIGTVWSVRVLTTAMPRPDTESVTAAYHRLQQCRHDIRAVEQIEGLAESARTDVVATLRRREYVLESRVLARDWYNWWARRLVACERARDWQGWVRIALERNPYREPDELPLTFWPRIEEGARGIQKAARADGHRAILINEGHGNTELRIWPREAA